MVSILCDMDMDLQKGHRTKTGDLLKWNTETVDCAQWVGYIRNDCAQWDTKRKSMNKAANWHRCEEEAPAALIHPKDVCLPKIVIFRGQQTKTVQEVSGWHQKDALSCICRHMYDNTQEQPQWRTSVLCLTNCCSHQDVWQGKDRVRGTEVTRSMLAVWRR